MENLKLRKVIYQDGDNQKYDYFILQERIKVKLKADELSCKLDPADNSAFIISNHGIDSGFELLLEKRTKSGDFIKQIHCNWEDIKIM